MFALGEKDASPACAGKAGDDVRVASAVHVADFARVLALLPVVWRHVAEDAVVVGESKHLFEMP